MADDEISEEGRRARFSHWEKLGLDEIEQDLATGGHRLIGGPPQVRALAREFVRIKKAERTEATIEALRLSRNPTLEAMGLSTNPALEAFGLAPVSVPQNSGEAAVPKPAEPRSTIPAAPAQELLTLKPGIWGMSIDLKEVGRRIHRHFKKS